MSKIEKIKADSSEIKREVRKRVITYITAGLGLVSGLAWNDAIKGLIEYLFPLAKNTLLVKFSYAFVITVILAVIAYYLSKIIIQEENN